MSMGDDFQDRFGGVGRLFGATGLARLRSAHVCVVGVGGVGSWTVEALARTGVGALTLVDLDDVCVTNVNRQLPALDGNVGRPKVEVLKERVGLINPACEVVTRAEFFIRTTAEALLAPRFDVVVDAIDSLSNKALLIASCVERGLACVTVGGAGGKRDATQIRTGELSEAVGDDLEAEDPPDPLVGDHIDLGAVAREFVALGLDPYPRKPGVVFAYEEDAPGEESPFARLAALKPKTN